MTYGVIDFDRLNSTSKMSQSLKAIGCPEKIHFTGLFEKESMYCLFSKILRTIIVESPNKIMGARNIRYAFDHLNRQ